MDNFMMNRQVEELEDFSYEDYLNELGEGFFQAVMSLIDYCKRVSCQEGKAAIAEAFEQVMIDDDNEMKDLMKNYNITSLETFEDFLEKTKNTLEKGEKNE